MNHFPLVLSFALAGTLLVSAPSQAAPEPAPTAAASAPVRVAVLVGANGAAPGRRPLLYSHRDVDRMSEVLRSVGGFHQRDVFVLKDPSPSGLVGALAAAVNKLSNQPHSLLYFFYSGHADEQALYPGGQAVSLGKLRALIDDAKVSVKIGVVDACRGGSWTRAKGLVPEEPFAVRWPVSLDTEGSVLIASSSGLESAHESDRLQGSFFTYHFTGGLRGAADRNANGEITLTEAFEYAKERTIRDTLRVALETQHPSYAVNLRGRRDLVLAQVAASPSTLSLSQEHGPLELIHAESGLQLLELPAGPRRVKLAVPPGSYLVRRRMAEGNFIREIVVAPGARNEISEAQLTLVGQVGLAAKSSASTVVSTPVAVSAPLPVAVPQHAEDSPAVRGAPSWVKAGAIISAGAAVGAFALAFKFAGDLNTINQGLDPFRRFPCSDGFTVSCGPQGNHVSPLSPAEQEYVHQLQDEGRKFERLQYQSLAVAGVMALASVSIHLLLGPWRGRAPHGAIPVPAPGGLAHPGRLRRPPALLLVVSEPLLAGKRLRRTRCRR